LLPEAGVIRGGLFTRYWLNEGIRETAQYRALDAERMAAFADDQRARWSLLARMARPSEAETESEFIHPLLAVGLAAAAAAGAGARPAGHRRRVAVRHRCGQGRRATLGGRRGAVPARPGGG
jgi:hypothetical protein